MAPSVQRPYSPHGTDVVEMLAGECQSDVPADRQLDGDPRTWFRMPTDAGIRNGTRQHEDVSG